MILCEEVNDIVLKINGISFTWEGIGITVAAVFSVISFLGNIFLYIHKTREQKRQNGIEYITNKRVDWIYAVRQEASAFLSLAHVLAKPGTFSDDDIIKLNEKLYILELYLNFGGIIDRVLIQLMYQIIEDVKVRNSDNANMHAQMFCNNLRIYLKVEWNRVKAEANGEKYDKRRNLAELLSAYKAYRSKEKLIAYNMQDMIGLLEQELKKNLNYQNPTMSYNTRFGASVLNEHNKTAKINFSAA